MKYYTQNNELTQIRLEENEVLFKRYGRGFLKKFMMNLPAHKMQEFDCLIYNFHGQNSADMIREYGREFKLRGAEELQNEVQNEFNRLKACDESQIVEANRIDSATLIKIGENEKFLKKYGGKKYLQRYLPILLGDSEYKVFRTILKFNGETASEMAQMVGLSTKEYKTTYGTVMDKIRTTNFKDLADYIDFREIVGGDLADETLDLEKLEVRRNVVRRLGGANKVSRILEPTLDDDAKLTLRRLYLFPCYSTLEALALEMGRTVEEVDAIEKRLTPKLNKYTISNLEKIQAQAVEFLDREKRVEEHALRLKSFGGLEYVTEKFYPGMTDVEKEVFKRYYIEGLTTSQMGEIVPEDVIIPQQYVEGILDQIKKNLSTLKRTNANFDEEVAKFNAEKETKVVVDEKEHPYPPELVTACGGVKRLVGDFLPKLPTILSQYVCLRSLVKEESDAEISARLKNSTPEQVKEERMKITEKMQTFAQNRSKL